VGVRVTKGEAKLEGCKNPLDLGAMLPKEKWRVVSQ
jgi:hypothetical protein